VSERQSDHHTPETERIVQFSCGGIRAVGILHTPVDGEKTGKRTGIIFVNAGIRSRRGPNRFYVRLARQLCTQGYHVLRFDLPGIGDSPGQLKNVVEYKKTFLDCNECVLDAALFFKSEVAIDSLGLLGLCGGAYSALMAGVDDPHVNFMILASLPVQHFGEMSEEAVTGVMVTVYLRKAFRWRAWRRFLTGQSQYLWAMRALGRILRGQYKMPQLDQNLWEAFQRFTQQGKQILCVYGDQDPLYRSFERGYVPQIEKSSLVRSSTHIQVISGANHNFSQLDWQQELTMTASTWLNTLSDHVRSETA